MPVGGGTGNIQKGHYEKAKAEQIRSALRTVTGWRSGVPAEKETMRQCSAEGIGERVFMEVCGVTIDFEKQNGYFFNANCMEGMKQFPDKYFDLAVVDPPYGDGGVHGNAPTEADSAEHSINTGKMKGGYWNRFGQRFDRYKQTLATEECSISRRNMEQAEQVEHGRRNSQKNHCVGCRPETGIL